ncbi:MAG: hypothetical protein AAGI45_00830 [Cyanobacteria bacterium P01_H01_bin.26]
MTPKSGLFLAGTCITAIAGVGSVFELAYGEPDLGVVPTSIVLALSIPITVIFFIVAVKDTRENQQW